MTSRDLEPQPGDTWPPDDAAALAELERSAWRSRRAAVAGLDDEALGGLMSAAWGERSLATDRLIAAIEEALSRAVAAQVPQAAAIVLREDTSHGQPHGHVHAVLAADGTTLADGASDRWHDADWTADVDEYAWDLHHLGRDRFRYDGAGMRVYAVPVSPAHGAVAG